jgi:signal transduction histidine kinase
MTQSMLDQFSLLNQVPLGICVLQNDYRVVFWNQYLEEWTHISPDRIVGHAIHEFFPHFKSTRYTSRLDSVFQGGLPTVLSSQLHPHLIPAPLHTGENRIQHTTITAVPTATAEVFYAMLSIQDVTDLTFRVQEYRQMRDRAVAEAEERKQAQETAESANRVKDEFLAIVSHELRTPLNAILGWSKLLRDGKLAGEKGQRAIETIAKNATLQAQLIDDLLDVSRIFRGKVQLRIKNVDLAFMIRSAIDTVRTTADAKSITLYFNQPESTYCTQGDFTRLQQVVLNLLSNAIKFTPARGQVEITLAHHTHADQPAIALSVQDNGQGIAADFLPHVFDSFRQADGSTTRSIGGLGLGLAITRHLVELHEGFVTAESAGVNQGARFTVVLPRSELRPCEAIESSTPSSSGNLQGMKILIVDDEQDSLDFMSFFLQEQGMVSLPASSVKAAIAILDQTIPALIISDLGMPDNDGYDLIRYVRSQEKLSHIPAIALTAYVEETTQKQVIAAGFQQHLSKPMDVDNLTNIIQQLVLAMR